MSWFLPFLSNFWRILVRAAQFAHDRGLDEALIDRALQLVTEAADRPISNTEKAQWVVDALVQTGVPESVARLAVEVAVQLWKARQGS